MATEDTLAPARVAGARNLFDDRIAFLEQAVALGEKGDIDSLTRARSSFELAKALSEAGRDRDRAIELARRATEVAAETEETQRHRAEVEAWLRDAQ